ncbi:efflux RND transporter periplasmic adaptor subunit [Solirhodobacter olei]|uniref:efflux RND transporter periplasmic adaptor subunit n=1 Tax=Solirhodobacter olei TaxID=2493082 RepID=UPI0013E353B7|nr:efflux RND transporter periplasmic adaptor subunit [Solirhodobacter olei]
MVLLVVLVAGVGFGLWTAFLRPVPVEAAGVATDVPVQVFGLGTVEARVSSKIGFQVPGVLVDLRADVGDRVAKGTVLARLDDRVQKAVLTRADATVEQANAGLAKAQASLDKAQVNYANARSVNERRQVLLQGNTTSVEAAQAAQASEDAAKADVTVAQSEMLVARANISDARAQQQQQAAILSYYTLVAPYDAMVTARNEEPGSALTAGESVFTLVDPKSIWVLAYVDESKAGDIKVGQPATIVLRSHPTERLAGRVARIEPESDRVNEERKVEIAFSNPRQNFNLGEQAEAYVTTMRLPQALLVPEVAILDLSKDSGTVWTVEDGQLKQHKATLGHRLLDGRYEITGGVPEGARVVTVLRAGLRAGRAANVVNGRGQ